ncbi:DNA phosphorothioation-associated protein 4 [Mycobacterium parascrofulaceum]|nr:MULTISPECIES: DNA phosphorothioation-associated protein 4 [Mycobacterium]
MAPPRFSPPKEKIDIIKYLTSKGSPFAEYRDILFFAAMIGWHKSRRIPLQLKGEAIRWDVMTNRHGTEYITDMIAVADAPDDPSILATARQDERVQLLEEYAHGGLQVLEEMMSAAGAISLETLFINAIQEALAGNGNEGPLDLADEILNL